MSLLVQIAAEFTGKKALKDADKGIQNLTKSTKKLAGALGVALSTTAVVNFGKASVKAFVEAEKANTRLAGVVKNLGLSFAQAEIQKNLDEISRSAGIAGEVLVDAYQPLLTATGSVIQSQKLLQQALDISAGSGVELTTVTQDLANAYVGNFKGIKKYNLGISQAELKTTDFLKVQTLLNEQFSGSNAKYLETYAGKMQVLGEAAGNAQEVIGGALVNALQDVFGAADITELIGKIDILAAKTANMIDDLAWKWKKFWFVTEDKSLLSLLNPFSNYIEKGLDKIDAEKAAITWRRAMEKAAGFGPDSRSAAGVNSAAAAKAEAEAKKRAAELLKQQKALLAEQKKQAALKKAGSIFDKEQIQIIAALKGEISAEDRKRLELQLALETENVTEAKKLTYELAIAQGLGVKLAQDLASLPAASNPFAAWKGYLDEIELQAKRIASFGGGTTTPTPTSTGNVPTMPIASPSTAGSSSQFGSDTPWAQAAANSVYVQIDGKTIATALQDQSLSGISSKANRMLGMFGDFG